MSLVFSPIELLSHSSRKLFSFLSKERLNSVGLGFKMFPLVRFLAFNPSSAVTTFRSHITSYATGAFYILATENNCQLYLQTINLATRNIWQNWTKCYREDSIAKKSVVIITYQLYTTKISLNRHLPKRHFTTGFFLFIQSF